MPKARVNGIDIHYIERGEGLPLLLVHGFQNSHFTFRPIIDRLAGRFRVLALDLRGHGDSDKPAGPYTIQTFADDVLGFLDALEIERADYLGQSMGGRTGTTLAYPASRSPEPPHALGLFLWPALGRIPADVRRAVGGRAIRRHGGAA